jgi:hypothetical protein
MWMKAGSREGQIEARTHNQRLVLSHNYLLQQFRDLALIIQHDQQSMLSSIIEEMKGRARRHQSLQAYFYEDNPASRNNPPSSPSSPTNKPVCQHARSDPKAQKCSTQEVTF